MVVLAERWGNVLERFDGVVIFDVWKVEKWSPFSGVASARVFSH